MAGGGTITSADQIGTADLEIAQVAEQRERQGLRAEELIRKARDAGSFDAIDLGRDLVRREERRDGS